jgi:hypothetical protein
MDDIALQVIERKRRLRCITLSRISCHCQRFLGCDDDLTAARRYRREPC